MKFITAALTLLRNENIQLRNEVERLRNRTRSQLKMINSSIKRLSPVSTYCRGGQCSADSRAASSAVGNGGEDVTDSSGDGGSSGVAHSARREVPFASSLSKNPKTLNVLWDEYEFGLSGRKPAKLFNSTERGACRLAYLFRKGFWNLCSKMIARGYTSATAIDKIYDVYGGGLSVTKILCQINKDRRNGDHVQLCS